MSKGLIGTVRVDSSAAALVHLEAWEALFPSRIAFWWSVMVIGVPPRRGLLRTAVHTLVWLSSAELAGLGIPTLADLTGRERRAWRSGGMVVGLVPLSSTGRNVVRMAVSIGVKCLATSDTTRCRYCHSCW